MLDIVKQKKVESPFVSSNVLYRLLSPVLLVLYMSFYVKKYLSKPSILATHAYTYK